MRSALLTLFLGDKSNHIATIHLAQLLYIWPFFAFFSVPLLIPYAIPVLNMCRILLGSKSQGNQTGGSTPAPKPSSSFNLSRSVKSSKRSGSSKAKGNTSNPSQSTTEPPSRPSLSSAFKSIEFIFNSKFIPWAIYIVLTFVASAAIVKYNTIIHPFTLADNRHYMFYIFRYTIRRGAVVRFLLILPYTVSRWMVWGTLAGCANWISSGNQELCSAWYDANKSAPYTSYPLWIAWGTKKTQTDAEYPKDLSKVQGSSSASTDEQRSGLENDALYASVEPVSTSTGLIFLVATSLSLMTAPLVEPRYFIIPWVIWRLLVPAWRVHHHRDVDSLFQGVAPQSLAGKVINVFVRYDVRLIAETLWFIAINVATGYIFLMKPYVWKDEHGQILDDGRLQRFMW